MRCVSLIAAGLSLVACRGLDPGEPVVLVPEEGFGAPGVAALSAAAECWNLSAGTRMEVAPRGTHLQEVEVGYSDFVCIEAQGRAQLAPPPRIGVCRPEHFGQTGRYARANFLFTTIGHEIGHLFGVLRHAEEEDALMGNAPEKWRATEEYLREEDWELLLKANPGFSFAPPCERVAVLVRASSPDEKGKAFRCVCASDPRPAEILRPPPLDPSEGLARPVGQSLDVDGDRMILSARLHEPGTPFSDLARAYVAERSAGGWELVQELDPREEGAVVAVALDGPIAAVGVDRVGAVIVFERDPRSGSWARRQRLEGCESGWDYGESIDLVGGRLVVACDEGVTTLERSTGRFVEIDFLSLPDPSFLSKAIALDRDLLAVGLPGGGGVELFERLGDRWEPVWRREGEEESFGAAVALEDGLLAVGASTYLEDGPVRLFRRGADGWTAVAELSGFSRTFGQALAVRGSAVAVGDPAYGGVGAVFLYEEREGDFVMTRELFAPGVPPGQRFGSAVGLTDAEILIGGPRGYRTSNPEESAVFVIER